MRVCQFSHHESESVNFLSHDCVNSLIFITNQGCVNSFIQTLSIPSSRIRLCQFPHHESGCVNSLITNQGMSIPSFKFVNSLITDQVVSIPSSRIEHKVKNFNAFVVSLCA